MSLSLYDVSIPAFIRGFGNLADILEKGRSFANEKDMAHTTLLEARLYPDMAPLVAQVQRASDTAKFTAVRVGQLTAPSMEDKEASFDDLQARIAATVTFLKSVPADAINGGEAIQVEIPTSQGPLKFSGRDYVLGFALPNFYFHVTTAYALLRHKGVPVGKLDYLGRS